MGDIVYYSSQELDSAKVFTNSRSVAERFGRRHADVIKSIEKQIEMNKVLGHEDFTKRCFSLSTYIDDSGKENKMYEMNEDGFLSVATSFNGIEAHKIRVLLITEFRRMERELQRREVTREIGIDVRNKMTKAIQEVYEGERLGFKIKAFTDIAYLRAVGKTAKALREDLGVKKDANLRQYLNADQLKKLEETETTIAVMYQSGMDYAEIKSVLIK
jgi:Rha family phage regulatory protein